MNSIEEAKRFIEFNSKIVGDCLVFLGAKDAKGYGLIVVKGKTTRTHRIMAHSYGLLDLDDDSLVLHKNECQHKGCFKKEHLYVGDHSDNRRDVLESRPDSKRTYCGKGHELTPENIKIDIRGDRLCKICKKERETKANLKKARRKETK